MEKSICGEKTCRNFGKYCRIPGHAKGVEPKKITGIARVSPARKELNKEYAAVSRPLWQGKQCEVRFPGCTGLAQGMHHKEGKENKEKLLNMDEAVPCCNHCNTFIEANHGLAAELGLKKKRNTKTKRYDNTFVPSDKKSPGKGQRIAGKGKKSN